MDSYRQLKVWQLGMELAKEIYVLTRSFPKYETYGLASQMQRAAVSIPANIAEGQAKDWTKDYLRHLSMAQGSLAELETHLIVADALDYCKQQNTSRLLSKCTEERKMLSGLQRSLRNKLSS